MPTFPQTAQQQAPRSASELQALIARRDELAAQFQSVTQRRGMLAQERLNAEARANAGGTQDRAIVRELEAQVQELGARSTRIQRELARAEDAIADARSRGVSEGQGTTVISVPPAPTIPAIPQFPEVWTQRGESAAAMQHRYQRMMMAEALTFFLLAVIGGRAIWQAAKRRFSRESSAPQLASVQQAIDTIAIEVERISENQRYLTRLLAERPAEALPSQDAERVSSRSARGAG